MSKQTSSNIASLAGQVMSNNNSSNIQRQLAGSALAQHHSGKNTSEYMEAKASQVLQSSKYNAETKQLAASVLSQSTKKSWER
jgi:predicted 2-oxoglutarate/Fe(II)-dependent dioxygenase YbiX